MLDETTETALLENLKKLLDIRDDSQNDKLQAIVKSVYERLCVLLNVEFVPEQLQYIITEVSVIRFNRIGSEGMSSHTVEGETISFSTEDDFNAFAADIEAWQLAQTEPKKGRVRFI